MRIIKREKVNGGKHVGWYWLFTLSDKSEVTIEWLCNYLGITNKAVYKRINKYGLTDPIVMLKGSEFMHEAAKRREAKRKVKKINTLKRARRTDWRKKCFRDGVQCSNYNNCLDMAEEYKNKFKQFFAEDLCEWVAPRYHPNIFAIDYGRYA